MIKYIIFILILFINPFAYADTVTLRPNANITTGLSKTGCTYNFECVSDEDFSLTYVTVASGSASDWYRIDDSSTTGDISNVRLRVAVGQWGVSPKVRFGAKVGTTYSLSGYETITSSSYEWHNKDWSVSPATGSAWTWSEIDGIQTFLQLATSSNYAWCYEVELIVTYTPASSSRRIIVIH